MPRTIEPTTGDASNETFTEFTEDDLKTLRIELEKQLPLADVKRIADVLAKFTKDNPMEKRMEGVVSDLLLVLIYYCA